MEPHAPLFPIYETKPNKDEDNLNWLRNDSYSGDYISQNDGPKDSVLLDHISAGQRLLSKYRRLKKKLKREVITKRPPRSQINIKNPFPSKYLLNNTFIFVPKNDVSPQIYDAYYQDTKGDKDNLKYESFYQHHLASYSAEEKNILGLSYSDQIKTFGDIDLFNRKIQEFVSLRYYSKRHLKKSSDKKPSGILVKNYEPTKLQLDQDTSAVEQQDVMNENNKLLIQTKELYNDYLAKHPNDVNCWLKFYKFQKKIIHLDKFASNLTTNAKGGGSSASSDNDVARQLCAKQLAVLSKASALNPDNVDLHFAEVQLIFDTMCRTREAYLKFGPQVGDVIDETTLQLKWGRLLELVNDKEQQQSLVVVLGVWKAYLSYVVRSRSNLFSYSNFNFTTSLLDPFKRYFSQVLKPRLKRRLLSREDLRHIQMAALEALAMLTMVLTLAGYTEYAVAIYQALIEFNFFAPDFILTLPYDKKIDWFRLFWENRSKPKLGEKGALGWRHSLQPHKNSSELFHKMSSPNVDASYYKSLINQQYKVQLDDVSKLEGLMDEELALAKGFAKTSPSYNGLQENDAHPMGDDALWASLEQCRETYQFFPTRQDVPSPNQSADYTSRVQEDPELWPTWAKVESFTLWLYLDQHPSQRDLEALGSASILTGLANGLWNVLGWTNLAPAHSNFLASLLLSHTHADYENLSLDLRDDVTLKIDSLTTRHSPLRPDTLFELDFIQKFESSPKHVQTLAAADHNSPNDRLNSQSSRRRLSSTNHNTYSKEDKLEFSLNFLALVLPIYSSTAHDVAAYVKLLERMLALLVNSLPSRFLSPLIPPTKPLPISRASLSTLERFIKRALKVPLFRTQNPGVAVHLWTCYSALCHLQNYASGPNPDTSDERDINPIGAVISMLCDGEISQSPAPTLASYRLCLAHFVTQVERTMCQDVNFYDTSISELAALFVKASSERNIAFRVQKLYQTALLPVLQGADAQGNGHLPPVDPLRLQQCADAIALQSTFLTLLAYLNSPGHACHQPTFEAFERAFGAIDVVRTDLIKALASYQAESMGSDGPTSFDREFIDADIQMAKLLHTYDVHLFNRVRSTILNCYALTMAHAFTPSISSASPERVRMWSGRLESTLVQRILNTDPYLGTALAIYSRIQVLKQHSCPQADTKGIVQDIISSVGGFSKMPFYRTLISLYASGSTETVKVTSDSLGLEDIVEQRTNDYNDPGAYLSWFLADLEWELLRDRRDRTPEQYGQHAALNHITNILEKLMEKSNLDAHSKALIYTAALNFQIFVKKGTAFQECKNIFYRSLRETPYSKMIYLNAARSAFLIFQKNPQWEQLSAPLTDQNDKVDEMALKKINEERDQRLALINILESMADKDIRIRTLLPEIQLYKLFSDLNIT